MPSPQHSCDASPRRDRRSRPEQSAKRRTRSPGRHRGLAQVAVKSALQRDGRLPYSDVPHARSLLSVVSTAARVFPGIAEHRSRCGRLLERYRIRVDEGFGSPLLTAHSTDPSVRRALAAPALGAGSNRVPGWGCWMRAGGSDRVTGHLARATEPGPRRLRGLSNRRGKEPVSS